MFLAEYEVAFEYSPGKKYVVVGALSCSDIDEELNIPQDEGLTL
jgi:hypothetical protein